jgi:anti-sigma factor RsiW
MKCNDITGLIYTYYELSPADKLSVDEHLDDCESCREHYAAMQTMMTIVGRASEQRPAPANAAKLTGNIMEVISTHDARARRSRRSVIDSLLVRSLMAACSLVLIVMFIGQQLPSKLPEDPMLSKHVVALNTASFLKEVRENISAHDEPTPWYACARTEQCEHPIIQKIKTRIKR